MPRAPLPANEQARLAALRRLQLLDTPPEEAFDGLTRLVASLLEVPIAVVSLVDEHRQWFKSAVGIDASETPRDIAFCAHAIFDDQPLVIADASKDDRFADNPDVLDGLKVRAYAGIPLLTSDGQALGTLCAIDQKPRRFNDHQLGVLRELANVVQREIRAREAELAARLLADERLQDIMQRERLYQATFERAAIGIAIVSLQGTWLQTNPALCAILGRSAEELASLTFQQLTHPEDLDTDLALLQQLLDKHRDHYTLDKRYIKPDGSIVWGKLTVTLVWDCQGQPMHIVAMIKDITARRASDTLKDLYENAPCGYYSVDASGTFVQINEASMKVFGASREALIGLRSPSDFFTDEGRQRFAEVFPRFMREGSFGPEEFDLIAGDGQLRRVSVTATALHDDAGQFLRSRTVIFDVTELHRTRLALQAINKQQHLMLDNELFAIVKLKNRHITWANRALEKMLGYGPGEMEGKTTRDMYPYDETYDRLGSEAYVALAAGRTYRTQLELIARTGEHIWVDMSGAQLDPVTGESLWMMLDISAMKKYQAEVETLAFHDSLTGLPNRMLLMDRLSLALASARRSGEHIAVCFGDLNGFKQVNDDHGHDAGDYLLREVGKRLTACVREHDTVARLGGDEFIVVLTQLATPQESNEVLDRISQALAAPIALPNGKSATVGISFGLAYGDERSDAATLISQADARMYAQKRARNDNGQGLGAP